MGRGGWRFLGRAMPRPTLLLAGFMFPWKICLRWLSFLRSFLLGAFLFTRLRDSHVRLSWHVTFKFSSWSARDSSTAGSGMTRFCMDPNWCVVTSTSDLPGGAYGAVKWISDSYLMVALLIPVHTGQESCGGMRTRLSLRWSRRRAIKVEVGPSLAARSTVLSAGSTRITATPMTLVPPSLHCSPASDRMCEASVETGVK